MSCCLEKSYKYCDFMKFNILKAVFKAWHDFCCIILL